MDKIEQLLGLGLSREQAEQAALIFKEEGGEAELLRSEIERLTEVNLKQAEEFGRQLGRSAADIKVLEALYRAGAKNPRFIMGAIGAENFELDVNGEVKGLGDRIEALKESDPYLFFDGAPVLVGFQPEQEGDFSPDGSGEELTYSEMVERLAGI